MPGSNANTSRNNNISGVNKDFGNALLQCSRRTKLERVIYEIFKNQEEDGNIKIIDILNKIDFGKIRYSRYRKIKFSYDALLRAILLMKIKGIKSLAKLVLYLENHKREARQIGFTKIPNRRTFSHFINHILDDKTKALIDFTAKKIVEIANKFSIDLDVEIHVEKPEKKASKSTIYYKKDRKTKELVKLLKKKIAPFLEMNLNGNCIYNKNNFIDLLIHMALTQDFAENGSKTLKELRQSVPDADTLLYHLKNYDDIEALQRAFRIIFEKLWEIARKENLFNPYRRYDIAVDFTDWLFYGDRSAPMVMGRKPERGTNKCYRFATINIVENNRRFTLLALPVTQLDKTEEVLSKLLAYAKQRIKIRKVYVDRGFFSGKCIRIFNKHQLKFLMPCTAYSTVTNLLKITQAPCVVKDFRVADIPINVVIVEEDGKKYAFASNEDWSENDVDLADKVFRQYGKRWGIETSYRVKKYSFRSKTTSKNYFVRLFYFLFSVLLYNLWILINVFLCLALYGRKTEDYIITSKLFGTIFYNTKDG